MIAADKHTVKSSPDTISLVGFFWFWKRQKKTQKKKNTPQTLNALRHPKGWTILLSVTQCKTNLMLCQKQLRGESILFDEWAE